MKRIVTIGIVICCLLTTINGQTYYYKLTKKAIGQEITTNVSGGQFITFMADICYESDKKGINVGHGKLDRQASNSNFKEYRGDSYWGIATFKFKSDLSKLNVITNNGEIWVYTRSTPASSIKTCSLVRQVGKRDNNSQNSHTPPSSNTYDINSNFNYNSEYKGKSEYKSSFIKVKETCTFCKGSGKDPGRNYAPYYGGTRNKVKCDFCNAYDYLHSHGVCQSCKGKGYVERMRRK